MQVFTGEVMPPGTSRGSEGLHAGGAQVPVGSPGKLHAAPPAELCYWRVERATETSHLAPRTSHEHLCGAVEDCRGWGTSGFDGQRKPLAKGEPQMLLQ